MKKYSVCILDDEIPAIDFSDFMDDKKLLNENNFQHLIRYEDKWENSDLFNFVKDIYSSSKYYLTGFTSHAAFFNFSNNEIIAPDVVVFDWTISGQTIEDAENYLLKLLNSTYCLVAIYTQDDKNDEVTNIISESPFKDYLNSRLFIIRKEEDDCVSRLQEVIDERISNFSFSFSKELRYKKLLALNKVLSNLGKISFEQFINMFGENSINNKRQLTSIDLAEIISEKTKSELINIGFDEKKFITDKNDDVDEEEIRKIWSFRLYHRPNDKIVRKGDIISRINTNDDTLYLVLSSDCHLNSFWNKNFGYISLIPLHRMKSNSEIIKKKFLANNGHKLNGFKLTSLTNPNQIEGITILPGVKNIEGELFDYLLNPKEVFSVKINLPNIKNIQNIRTNLRLLYNYWRGYSGKERIRISEPFLSPLIQFIMDNITGYGCPDFSGKLQEIIKKNFDESRK